MMNFKKYLQVYTCCLALLGFSVTNSDAQNTTPALVPTPRVVNVGKGNFILNTATVIRTDAEGQRAVQFLTDYLFHTWKFKNKLLKDNKKTTNWQPGIIITTKGSEQLPDEGYRLSVLTTGITLTGKGAGLFYGIQTLLQLFPVQTQGTAAIPCLSIEDAPRFGYRGLMLDVSRHFFSVKEIKDLLDLMAYYKLNRFHWHLTDDQGWRLEIKSYPKLTEVGAWRVPRLEFSDNTLPPQPGEKATDGGFYTQEQVKEIIRYAAERHIEILPEIDVPGHSMAAIAAYPELCVTHNPDIKVNPGSNFAKWFPQGGFEMYVDNTLNPTDERVYQFLDKVLGEVAALFPYPYIHIGGDECYKGFWEKDAGVQAFIQQQHIHDMHELQGYFISRLNKIIQSKHKKLIGWDEILEGNLKDNIAVMNRFGEKGAVEQIKKGLDIVLAPGNNGLYFDYAQSNSDQEPSNHGGGAQLWKSYQYNPEYSALSKDDSKHILGIEACVWTEYMPTVSKLQYMLLPRLLSLAETGWTNQQNKSYPKFATTILPFHLQRFDKAGISYRVPTAFNYTDTTIVTDTFRFDVKPPVPGSKIFFTMNNRPPEDYDHEYAGPMTIPIPRGKKITLKTIVITLAGRRSIVTSTLLDNSGNSKND